MTPDDRNLITPRAQQGRRRAALAAAKKLDKAILAMQHYMRACRACGDHDDSCALLTNSVSRFASNLMLRFNVPPERQP